MAQVHPRCMRRLYVLCFSMIVLAGWHMMAGHAAADAWPCDRTPIPFSHQPSDYYGSGEYTTVCPKTDIPIRCYHYHRHWICEKQDMLYWDRNLESAARLACQCPLPPGMAPSSPAIVRKPENRFYSAPAPNRLPPAPNPQRDLAP